MFRDLREDEIEIRVGNVFEKGYTLLLYKNARADMNILDETVGAENWQRKHYECKGNLFCSVGIKTADGWVWKDDCGTESYTEKEKGESSDSFKRACVSWGIGRALYTAPFIWISGGTEKIDANDKYSKYKLTKQESKRKFKVENITYNNGSIESLMISDDNGVVVFNSKVEGHKIDEELVKELKDFGGTLELTAGYYGCSVQDLTNEQVKALIEAKREQIKANLIQSKDKEVEV